MPQTIEIELRGRLSDEQYQQLLSTLEKHGEYVQSKDRVLLDYSTFLPDEGVSNRTKDIRIRVTNGQPEIVTKLGGWGGDEHRKEISILAEKGSFDRLVETYAALGYTKAILAVRHTEVFNYEGFEFALVTVPGHSYYFEIEKVADDEKGADAVKQSMRALCEQLGIELFGDEGFYQYIEELNREVNEVFEFADYTPNYFATRFNLPTA